MKRDLKFEAVYPYPPERVWRALTDRDELTQWLMDNNFEAKVGHKFQFHGKPRPGFDGTVSCEVIELDQPRQITYRWLSGGLETVVRFQLKVANDGGTRLILEHTGFNAAGAAMISALIAWNRMLREKLPQVISGIPLSNVRCNIDIVNALIERYERGTRDLADVLGRVPKELVDVPPAEGGWTARQSALHVVDAEIVGAMRLRLLAAQPGSTLTAYNGDLWARELAYTQQPLEPALELFQALRRTTTEMLRRIPVSAWSHRGEHEEAGEVSLESLLDSHCEHAEAHLEEITVRATRLSQVPVASAP